MSPQAPDLLPSVAPSTSGVAGPSVNVPVDAFGGAVGHALQGLGQAVEGASDKIWQRAVEIQNLNNETEAKTADADYMMKAGMEHANFSALTGTQARDAFPGYMKKLQDMRTEARSGLSNPMAQKMFDASSLSVMGRTIFNGAGHAAQQAKVAANGASQARIDQMSDGIGAAPTDQLTYERYTRGIAAETRSQGQQNGWEPDQTNETVKQNISTAVAKRVVGLAKTDAIGAQAMFDRATKSGDLLPVMADKVQATVQTNFRQQGSRIISDRVMAGRNSGDEPERTEQEYVNEGLKAAEEIAKKTGINDPLFPDFVKQRIMTDYGLRKRVERDTDNQNVLTIGKAMLKASQDGNVPTNIEQLKAIDPSVSPALDALSGRPDKVQGIMKQLERNANGENRVPPTTQNLQLTHQYVGQANSSDNEERVSFLAKDFASEPTLTVSQKNKLMNLQDSMRKQSQDDPRVARAMSLLGPDLNSAGITRGTAGSADRESYYQFVGGLQDALELYQGEHPGKVPSSEEVRSMGAQLMQEHATGRRGWMFFNSEKAPTYQLPVSDADADRIRNLGIWRDRNIAAPTDAMIQRYYHAEKFKELFGKSAKKPEPTP